MRSNHNHAVYVALGSNLGDREANLKKALAMLIETPHLNVHRISSFIENPAVGGPEDSPDFLNAAVELTTTLSPHALMKRLLEIEREMGRTAYCARRLRAPMLAPQERQTKRNNRRARERERPTENRSVCRS